MQNFLKSRTTTIFLIALATVCGIHFTATAGENVRIDMTADNLYSLSDGTDAILAKMHSEGVKPIELKLYFSETAGKSLPRFIKQFITYEQYLTSLLKEYEVASKGKISVSFIDPVTDSDEAEDAEEYGLEGKPINQHGDLFFFGLAMETQTGSRDKIEFLWPNQQETVEYEITKKIHNLLWPTTQRIGVLSGLQVISDMSNPYMAQILAAQGKDPGESWISMQLLQESYEVAQLDASVDEISRDEYDLVIVVHPKSLSDRAKWALDEWVTRGGNTLVFVDPYSLDDRPPPDPQNQPWQQFQYKPASEMGDMLEQWGLKREEDRIAADFNLGVRRPTSRMGGAELVIVDMQITEAEAGVSLSDHPILGGLADLRFFLAGSLKTTETIPEGVTATPLISTTPEGNTLEMVPGFPEGEDLTFADISNTGRINDRFLPGTDGVHLAYMVQGKLPPYFPRGTTIPAAPPPPPPPGLPPGFQMPPPPDAEMVTKEAVPEEERGEATIVVFADVDFISDQIAFQQTPFGALAANDNHKVLLNAVDFLFGSEELMQVRAKKTIARPFTLFDQIEAQADAEMLDRERQIRADLELFQEQLREKQGSIGERNAALFEKQLQDEVDQLNERIDAANDELRDIRKAKRAALEGEERNVRIATLGVTPTLVLILGLFLFFRRRSRDREARRTA